MLTVEQTSIHEQALAISKSFKKIEIDLIEILQKVMNQRIYLALGFSSMWEYATEALGLSPSNAYSYTKIAKVADAIPEFKAEINRERGQEKKGSGHFSAR